ncbi:GNAT family N-acetyltransferase [Actinophytocola oryzae]|uniref:RimJ/RimL family protein N-acetyltransferase n=1 Tax=Actinophytocola oryzae TaxID=502181 RepID=A0A4V3FUD2_9PSEU|nr:GNAT family N-acetyltransferase [Actinophytocola oryzae]TDV54811.1 RimJ/RimL family protein N-acetyltransferase [Actinophytocola oryzae]
MIASLRHFAEEDLPLRTELLRDDKFQANLTDFATLSDTEALTASQRRTIEEEHDVKRIFSVLGTKGQVVGFVWLTSLDWRSQTCELSIAVLPRYRGAYGLAAIAAALRYIHDELNMETVINQVLAHNTMLQSQALLDSRHTVTCAYDSFTVGEWRTALFWADTREEYHATKIEFEKRRAERRDRIMAKVGAP